MSTAAASGPRAWHVERVGVEKNPISIACPSPTLCVVGEADRNVVTSTDPTGGAGTWRAVHVDGTKSVIGDSADLDGAACPTVSLCVAADDAGNVVSSTNPTGGREAWHVVRVPSFGATGPGFSAISCPSVN